MSATTTARHRRPIGRRRPWTRSGIVAVVVALAGGAILSYPLAAPWITDIVQADQLVSYRRGVDALDPREAAQIRDLAHRYNANLPNGPLRDPYVLNASGEAVSLDEGRTRYDSELRVPGVSDDIPMSQLDIPAIGVTLPVYHGTSEETLTRGVGHFYGSGLPVGGEGVHAVLTAHSGYVDATLFDDLDQLVVGDTFSVLTLGELLHYQVDSIATVLPDQSELLRQVPGEDYVTLVTCTPRYVNTHRLLVRGVRTGGPAAAEAPDDMTRLVTAPSAGVPWWALVTVGPAVGTFFLVRPPRVRQRAG
ncbi:class C sortase [Sanguibacter sp. A247]|uniref:class C sortase n=1 Tax=unclassified Sanguibacter TaxID=2645534 RepID=UPI003FD7C26A